jgi:acyl-CoA synthetase (AMP-forming)/AMP-acid ligase II
MIYSGPKFDGPNIDYLSWLLARRGYRDRSEVFVDAADPANCITYAELVDLTKRIGQGLREVEGIGAHGAGKDVVIVYSENQVSSIVAELTEDNVPSRGLDHHLCRRCILRYWGQHLSQ